MPEFLFGNPEPETLPDRSVPLIILHLNVWIAPMALNCAIFYPMVISRAGSRQNHISQRYPVWLYLFAVGDNERDCEIARSMNFRRPPYRAIISIWLEILSRFCHSSVSDHSHRTPRLSSSRKSSEFILGNSLPVSALWNVRCLFDTAHDVHILWI
jgi:hypothetical protein